MGVMLVRIGGANSIKALESAHDQPKAHLKSGRLAKCRIRAKQECLDCSSQRTLLKELLCTAREKVSSLSEKSRAKRESVSSEPGILPDLR